MTGKRISLELLEETEEKSGIPAELVPDAKQIESEIEKDFAAKQREISRNLLTSVSSDKEDEDEDTDSSKGVKVYDDIDPTESTKNDNVDEEDDDDDINALYEIPVARQTTQPASEADSLSQPADISSLATAGSMDDVNDDVLDTSSPGWQPPPLPPRTKKSESESRNSVNSLEDKVKPPELPFRPPLPRRNEIYARSEKSDKSEKSEKSDVSDGDSTSYESFDEHDQDSELRSKLNIKLPKRSKKKSKTGSKLLSSKARSSSTWEINVPFKKLDNVQLSATVGERDGKKGFEIKLTHKDGDTHLLAADFKEWASIPGKHWSLGLTTGPIRRRHWLEVSSKHKSAGVQNEL
nr:hypothetical protein BaRGS_032870 [Batillaria attramentaria]